MKKPLGIVVLVLIFSFQSWTKADDISDFEIEGMSIGDSLLDHFSRNKILKSEVDWYDDLEKYKFTAFAFDSSKFETYDFVDIFTKYGDKKYKIDSMAGVIYFSNNKKIKNINDCYSKQKEISEEILSIFDNAIIDGPHKTIFHARDPSGKSSYTDYYISINKEYEALVSCYDWSDHLEDKADHMYIGIRSHLLTVWLP